MSIIKEAIVRNGHGPLNPSYFCVHSTATPGAPAANLVNYWRANDVPCTHLVSDWTEAYHTIPYGQLCYQVGNGNPYVEGLEICEATNQTDFTAGIQIAAQVVAERLKAHGWGTDRLICHDDARKMWGGTDHTDPLPYFARYGYSWEQFKQLVAEKQGDTDMPAKTDQISYGGMNVTVEFALQDINHKLVALDKKLDALPNEIWYGQSGGDITKTPLYSIRHTENEVTKDKENTNEQQ